MTIVVVVFELVRKLVGLYLILKKLCWEFGVIARYSKLKFECTRAAELILLLETDLSFLKNFHHTYFG